MKKELLFTAFPLYAIGFLFNMIFSITAIIIPLYGLSVGYSATQIGILLSIPGIFQITLRVFTGIFSDRFGEKKMLILNHLITIFSCLIFLFNLNYMTLAVFQMVIGTSRAIFWPTSQSYASRIPNTISSTIIGRLHSANEGGKVFGMVFAGWTILQIGYLTTFRLIAVIGFIGLLINWVMKSIPLTGGRKKINNIGLSFWDLTKIPPLQLAVITAFTAGLLSVLAQSFLPVWLKGLGNSEALISLIVASYLVGSLLAGRAFANVLARLQFPLLLQLAAGGVGFGFLLVSLVKGLIPIFALTVILGFLAGFLTISYQVMGANYSDESNRGLIYSFVGMGWGVSFLVGPTLFGLLVDGFTVTTAFACLGLLLLVFALFIKVIYSRFVSSNQEEQKVSA